jgi:hypothetical protein
VGLVNLGLLLIGAALIAIGYLRARGPWARYQALQEQDANIARYDAWRGGLRDRGGETGASVAMQVLRRQAQAGIVVAGAGGVLILLGLILPSMP